MLIAWFLAICPPHAPIARCEVLHETSGERQCLLALRKLGHPRARCLRLPINED